MQKSKLFFTFFILNYVSVHTMDKTNSIEKHLHNINLLLRFKTGDINTKREIVKELEHANKNELEPLNKKITSLKKDIVFRKLILVPLFGYISFISASVVGYTFFRKN